MDNLAKKRSPNQCTICKLSIKTDNAQVFIVRTFASDTMEKARKNVQISRQNHVIKLCAVNLLKREHERKNQN